MPAGKPERLDHRGCDQTAAPRGRAVRSLGARNLLTFLMLLGPGLIVMEAGNDAGAVSTYVQAGAQYGTHLLWILIVLLPMSYFVQEMVVRLGIATGQGHATMIYKRFGRWWGSLLLITGLTCPFCLTVSFTGAAQESPLPESSTDAQMQTWNWHVQNTDVVQGDPGFPAKYSGPQSLNSRGEAQETTSLDLFAGVRLWRGAEAHVDGLMWGGLRPEQNIWHRGISQR